jgi:hypothetical protein
MKAVYLNFSDYIDNFTQQDIDPSSPFRLRRVNSPSKLMFPTGSISLRLINKKQVKE